MRRGSSAGRRRSPRSGTGSRRRGVLCLVGPSGCGKSSLIEAGVLADLESAEPAHWAVRTLRPGGSPMFALGEALGADLDDTTHARGGGPRRAPGDRGRRRGGPAAARRRSARGAVRAGEHGRPGAVHRRARRDPRARRRLDRARDPRRLLRRADGERAVAARRRRQGRRAAARGRRPRRGDRGAGEVVPRHDRAGSARAARGGRRQRAGCVAAPPGGARPPVGDDATAPDLARSVREHRRRGPRRPVGRGRGHGRRRAGGALARRRCRSPSACCSGSSSSGRAGPTRAASSGSGSCAARATTIAPLEGVLDVLATRAS